jgi:acyl-CoA thioester hydrolase
MEKILTSKAKIRFQDCDPFNHLNNAAYLNYMNNAREDQLIKYYGIDIYRMALEEGKSWVVGSNQIAYIKPAFLMEEVIIESQIIRFREYDLDVELKMWDHDREELKALMWSNFVHYDLHTKKKEAHSESIMDLFSKVVTKVESTTFEDRVRCIKKQ